MAPLKLKGDRAEIEVARDLVRRGFRIAIPYGEDWDFDLIFARPGHDELERVQVKHVTAKNGVIRGSLLLALVDQRPGPEDQAIHRRDDRLARGLRPSFGPLLLHPRRRARRRPPWDYPATGASPEQPVASGSDTPSDYLDA